MAILLRLGLGRNAKSARNETMPSEKAVSLQALPRAETAFLPTASVFTGQPGEIYHGFCGLSTTPPKSGRTGSGSAVNATLKTKPEASAREACPHGSPVEARLEA